VRRETKNRTERNTGRKVLVWFGFFLFMGSVRFGSGSTYFCLVSSSSVHSVRVRFYSHL